MAVAQALGKLKIVTESIYGVPSEDSYIVDLECPPTDSLMPIKFEPGKTYTCTLDGWFEVTEEDALLIESLLALFDAEEETDKRQ